MNRKLKIVSFSFIGILVVMLLIDTFIIPMKRIELLGLHSLYQKGSGIDEGVVHIIASNPQRYSNEIINTLKNSEHGSDSENMALAFVEIVIGQPKVREALAEFGDSHSIADTNCLVKIILSDKPKLQPIYDDSGNVLAYKAINSRFECTES